MYSLIAEQVPAGGGRWLGLRRWGFVADSTPELSGDIGRSVLFVPFLRCRTLAGYSLHKRPNPSFLSLGFPSDHFWCAQRWFTWLNPRMSVHDFPHSAGGFTFLGWKNLL